MHASPRLDSVVEVPSCEDEEDDDDEEETEKTPKMTVWRSQKSPRMIRAPGVLWEDQIGQAQRSPSELQR